MPIGNWERRNCGFPIGTMPHIFLRCFLKYPSSWYPLFISSQFTLASWTDTFQELYFCLSFSKKKKAWKRWTWYSRGHRSGHIWDKNLFKSRGWNRAYFLEPLPNGRDLNRHSVIQMDSWVHSVNYGDKNILSLVNVTIWRIRGLKESTSFFKISYRRSVGMDSWLEISPFPQF